MKWSEKKGVELYKADLKALERAHEIVTQIARLEQDSVLGSRAEDAANKLSGVLDIVDSPEPASEPTAVA